MDKIIPFTLSLSLARKGRVETSLSAFCYSRRQSLISFKPWNFSYMSWIANTMKYHREPDSFIREILSPIISKWKHQSSVRWCDIHICHHSLLPCQSIMLCFIDHDTFHTIMFNLIPYRVSWWKRCRNIKRLAYQ